MTLPSRLLPAIVTALTLLGLSIAFAQAPGSPAPDNPAGIAPVTTIQAVKADLSKLDSDLYQGAKTGQLDDSEALKTASLRTGDMYRRYLAQAEAISQDLITIRERMQNSDDNNGDTGGAGTLSLQELGALTQHLSMQNDRFKAGLTHGEDQLQSCRLIQKAVENLQDAIFYWRTVNKYRELYRQTAVEKIEDDDVLKLRIQTAITAIDELDEILKIRGELDKLE